MCTFLTATGVVSCVSHSRCWEEIGNTALSLMLGLLFAEDLNHRNRSLKGEEDVARRERAVGLQEEKQGVCMTDRVAGGVRPLSG